MATVPASSSIYQKYRDMLTQGKTWGEVANKAKKELGKNYNWDMIDQGLNKSFWSQGGAYGKYKAGLKTGQDLSGFIKEGTPVQTTTQTNTSSSSRTSGGGGGGGYVAPTSNIGDVVQARVASQAERDAEYARVLQQLYSEMGISGPYVESPFDSTGARAEAEKLNNPWYEDQKKRLVDKIALDRRGTEEDYSQTAASLINQKEGQGISNASSETSVSNATANNNMARSGLGMRDFNLTKLAGQNKIDNLGLQEQAATQIKAFNLDKITNDETTKSSDLLHQRDTGIKTDFDLAEQRFREAEAARRAKYSNAQTVANARVFGY